MRQKSDPTRVAAEKLVRDIRRATRKQYSAEEKIRIVPSRVQSRLDCADAAVGCNQHHSGNTLLVGRR